ncbi:MULTISPECIES: class I poly(R)-hydroxyalkanoic acid synthase [unclassified Marinobacter]|jgi:polyhydroxyalkanoate synthase|uniref:PHA/PHB synthase family protein n=1 Tax=unclassified Marinobacter TaxID=83889 RepID=UPI00200E5BB5|nr:MULTISPECIES: class I poly(R)-hydroxyalkanoic acid synthase [unclassified Marinobacter]MCL1484441.1 class I poly(R)-hydroxyalkanoic acid synthase [Marinobacter sp.]UQG57921.1 class I poly(R)-hydroxyalkanoic acid synthase [Marinobacter sp. M4C]UQG66726.1 class I poly(R)-hydroxyalkanoic acid synthase [Marinobacter sp. M2C]UQG71006.1 class I poly(R)-hydroxyalkanoic acid synthase [Marinobacter sp. M1C]
MLGMEKLSKTKKLVAGVVDTNVRRGQERLAKMLGDKGLVSPTTLSMMGEMSDIYKAMAADVAKNPLRTISAESDLLRKYLALGSYTFSRAMGKDQDAVASPESDDRRFQAEDWSKHLPFDLLLQAYLINSQAFQDWLEGMDNLPKDTRDQMLFYARQVTSALSPANFLVTNPEALRITWESKGKNLVTGGKQFIDDYRQNPKLFNVGMTDRSAFEVGGNLATTPGKVVFQNELIQLIQYTATTETVAKRPMLIVPPWINKFYILDLTARNSFIQWLVNQGQTVFVVSWLNPGPSQRDLVWDDYMQKGVVAAMDNVTKATGEAKMNLIGYCVGGTLVASTLSWLKKKGRKPTVSVTYFTTLLDFTDPGGISIYINDRSLAGIEKMMNKKGFLDGRAMAFTFNLLRENELFWSFWTKNYLKGEKPAAFDLLYWNTDGTNLPAALHGPYLREMYLNNRLVQPDSLTFCGETNNLQDIDVPSMFIAARQDHIAKWKSCYTGAQAHGGKVKFLLGGSGHIAGIINPPYKEKYGFWTNNVDTLPENPDDWLAEAEQHPGSWWPHWVEWLAQYQGDQVPARVPGDGKLKALEDAPGSYVKVRAADAAKS